MGKLWKIIATPFLIPVAAAFAYEAVLALMEIQFDLIAWVVYGAIAFLVFFLFVFRTNNFRFVETFEHELCHAVVSFVTFDRIQEYHATSAEVGILGYVKAPPWRAGFLNYLAPYYLPILTIPLLLLSPFSGPAMQHILEFLIGFSLAFHYIGLLREWGCRQTDIQENTYVFSLLITILLNAIILAGTVSVVLQDMDFFVAYFQNSMERAADMYATAWQFIQPYI